MEIEKQLEKEEPEPASEDGGEAKEGEGEAESKDMKGAGPEEQEGEKMAEDETIKKSPKFVRRLVLRTFAMFAFLQLTTVAKPHHLCSALSAECRQGRPPEPHHTEVRLTPSERGSPL